MRSTAGSKTDIRLDLLEDEKRLLHSQVQLERRKLEAEQERLRLEALKLDQERTRLRHEKEKLLNASEIKASTEVVNPASEASSSPRYDEKVR